MNRLQLIHCIGREIQTALQTYTGDAPSRLVTDSVAVDVLGALKESLMIDDPKDLARLPARAVVIDKHGFAYQHGEYDLWHQPGDEMSGYSDSVDLPVCPECGEDMVCMGKRWKPPRRTQSRKWKRQEELWRNGYRPDGTVDWRQPEYTICRVWRAG